MEVTIHHIPPILSSQLSNSLLVSLSKSLSNIMHIDSEDLSNDFIYLSLKSSDLRMILLHNSFNPTLSNILIISHQNLILIIILLLLNFYLRILFFNQVWEMIGFILFCELRVTLLNLDLILIVIFL